MDGDLKSGDGLSGPGPQVRERRRSELTQEAFDLFLARLSPDRDLAGTKYLEVHKRLERFFEWRGCPSPQDHADEAITRTAHRISQGDSIQDPATYVIGVARLLVLEIYKQQEKDKRIASVQGEPVQTAPPLTESEDSERRVECLRGCLDKLPAGNRDLILMYYEGEKSTKIGNRKKLTEQLQVSVHTLRMRALRIRERLMVCVEGCTAQAG